MMSNIFDGLSVCEQVGFYSDMYGYIYSCMSYVDFGRVHTSLLYKMIEICCYVQSTVDKTMACLREIMGELDNTMTLEYVRCWQFMTCVS